MKVRKKPFIVEAHRWFVNGDHPEDDSKYMVTVLDKDYTPKSMLSEGKIVRYYRHPRCDGERVCGKCGYIMQNHGWIDTLEGGHIVCPGDWIIKGIQGEFYPCKPDIFEQTYERVE
jgi:hypothetical protein